MNRFGIRVGAAFFVVLLLMVWEHVEARRMDRQIKNLRQEADRLTYENGRLETQIHQWTSPSHLDHAARQDFGMAPLDPKRVVGLPNP